MSTRLILLDKIGGVPIKSQRCDFRGILSTLYEAIRDNVRQGLCNTLNLAERTATLGASFYNAVGLRGAGVSSEAAAQLWGNLAGLACNRPPVDVSSGFDPPPFTGGQCPGTVYRLEATVRQERPDGSFTNPQNQVSFPVTGPITFVSEENPDGLTKREQWVGANGNGVGFSSMAIENTVEFTNMLATATSGPDDCGDPPGGGPQPYDPADFTTTPTVNYTDDGGQPRTFSPTITYAPVTVSPSGELSVPISVVFEDGSSLFGDFNFSTGDISFGGGNSGGDGTGGGPAELPPGEPPSDSECLVAVRIVVTGVDLSVGRITELFSSGASPNLYVPRLATVMFRVAGESGNGWSPPVDIKTLESIVPAPPGKILDWAVFPRVGVSLQSFALVAPCCECKE